MTAVDVLKAACCRSTKNAEATSGFILESHRSNWLRENLPLVRATGCLSCRRGTPASTCMTVGASRKTVIMDPILEVQGLQVAYHARTGGALQALAGVSFSLMPGETLGVLGESGSGKSTLAASILKLFPSRSTLATGRVLFEGKDLLQAGADELQKIRGRRISLIFQEPSVALHPTIRAGQQIRQVLKAHGMKRGAALEEETQQLIDMVFPDEAKRIARSYPHQLSGGQRQ